MTFEAGVCRRLLYFASPPILIWNAFNIGHGGKGVIRFEYGFCWRLLYFANTGPRFESRFFLTDSGVCEYSGDGNDNDDGENGGDNDDNEDGQDEEDDDEHDEDDDEDNE